MEKFIQVTARHANDNFAMYTNLQLIEDGVPANAVFDVMLGIADGYEEKGWYVEMEVSYDY